MKLEKIRNFIFDLGRFGLCFCLWPAGAGAQDSPRLDMTVPGLSLGTKGMGSGMDGAGPVGPSDLSRVLPGADATRPDITRALRSAPVVVPGMIDQGLAEWTRGAPGVSAESLNAAASRLGHDAASNLRRGLVHELVDGDVAAAVELYRSAAAGGDVEAAILAGRASLYGLGGVRDPVAGRIFLTQALGASDPELKASAALELGNAYRIGVLTGGGSGSAERYMTLAADADPQAIPLTVDFLLNDRGKPAAGRQISDLIARSSDAGNVSALYQTYLRSDVAGEKAAIFARIKGSSSKIAGRYVGDIARAEGRAAEAFAAYRGASLMDPYALAQAGILALENPALDLGMSKADALSALSQAAGLGEPSAFVALAMRTEDPDAQYSLAINGMEHDPGGNYGAEFESILTASCASDAVECRPTPVWFVTNRVPRPDGTGFQNRRDETLHVGLTNTVIRTDLDPDAPPRTVVEEGLCRLPFVNCAMEHGVSIGTPEIVPAEATPPEFFATLKAEAANNGIGNVVVFIHGFNNSFNQAATRLALLMNRGKVKAVPVIFDWASGAETLLHWDDTAGIGLAYEHDRVMAEASCQAFQGALRDLADTFGATHVQVVAHSMGSYFLDLMASGCGDAAQALGQFDLANIVLAAADLDAAAFAQRYDRFRPVSKGLTLYVSANDAALKISASIMNPGLPRLGQGGTGRFLRDDAMTIDLTPLEQSEEAGIANHANVFDVPEARRDVDLLLNGFVSDQIPRCLEPITAGRTGYFLTRNAC